MNESSLRKHAYSNILKILQPKKENFQIKKKSDNFHIPAQNIYCEYSLEPPRRGGSNENTQSMFEQEYENIKKFYLKIFFFLVVKFSIYLNRVIFEMKYNLYNSEVQGDVLQSLQCTKISCSEAK